MPTPVEQSIFGVQTWTQEKICLRNIVVILGIDSKSVECKNQLNA